MSTVAFLRGASWRTLCSGRCVNRGIHRLHLARNRALYQFPAWSTRPSVNRFSVYSPLKKNEDRKEPTRILKPLAILRENIYTIPNVLTVSRILACPVLGWAIVHDNFQFATALLVYAGLTDTVCLSSLLPLLLMSLARK